MKTSYIATHISVSRRLVPNKASMYLFKNTCVPLYPYHHFKSTLVVAALQLHTTRIDIRIVHVVYRGTAVKRIGLCCF